jgi:hypothetical protein
MGNNIFKVRETAKVNKSGMSHTMNKNKKKKNNKKKRGW